MMTEVIDFNRWRTAKRAAVADAPSLACPRCEADCAAIKVESDGTTAYRCAGHGHRAMAWRIDANGDMLRGLAGRRFY